MAIGGKSAGIVAGLAVGLTSGAFLAAMNPVLPRQDTTQVGQSPEVSAADQIALEQEQGNPPQLSQIETETGPADTAAALPDQAAEETNPKPLAPVATAPRASDVTPLDSATDTPESVLAVLVPETGNTPVPETREGDISATAPDQKPTLSTTPADPVKLEKPNADTTEPSGLQQAVVETTTAVETPTTSTAPEATSAAKVMTAPDSGATLPSIQGQADRPTPAVVEPEIILKEPKPEQTETQLAETETQAVETKTAEPEPEPVAPPSAPNIDASTAEKETAAVDAPEDEGPNTSGTFKTQGSRLPTVGESEDRLASLGQGGSSKRIPSIGASTTPETEVEAVVVSDLGALKRNANPFDPTPNPLLTLVLLDDGSLAAQLPNLQDLGLPIAVAISLDDPNAAQNASRYRAAGFEVLALTPRDVKLSLSGGQTDAQVAEALDRIFQIVPDAIGLIDRPTAHLQKDQRLSRAVLRHFNVTGHGLITYAGGLNAVPRLAAQENVASSVVTKFVDEKAKSPVVITSQLNRAARQARSKGHVIIMATPAQATIGTILNWSLSSNANGVTFAPVSAALLDTVE